MNVVIIGLGYVGLPLAQEAVRAGLNVTGFDVNQGAVDGLNAGRSHIDDLTDADIAAMVANGFRATADLAGIPGADTIVICVPTPLNDSRDPDLTYIEQTAEQIAAGLQGVKYQFEQAASFQAAPNETTDANFGEAILYGLIVLLIGEQVLAWSAGYHPPRRHGLAPGGAA